MVPPIAKLRMSVVIATFNRAELLSNCLRSLQEQILFPEAFEIIVVDNNSTDDTQKMAGSFSKHFPNYAVLGEERQGLSHARNRGWRVAKSEYVAFIDDDAKVPPDWLEKVIAVIDEYHPDVLGGPIYPYYTTEKPAWFKDEYEIRMHQDHSGWMEKGFISGSNMIFKRAVLEELGGFDVRYGMRGGQIAYGEDTEMIKRARERGKKIYYSVEIAVQHHVPPHKMDIIYALTAAYRKGTTTSDLWEEGAKKVEMAIFPDIIDEIFLQLNSAAQGNGWDKKRYPSRENYLYETCLPRLFRLGILVGAAKKYGWFNKTLWDIVRNWAVGRLRGGW